MGTDLWEVHWVRIDFARIDVMGVDFVRVDLMAPNHVLFSRWSERPVPTFWIRRRNVWRSEEVLISFDVTLLFINVPIDGAVDVIHRKLTNQEGEDLVERTPLSMETQRIAELLQLCLKFIYNREFYEQRQGQPWVPLSLLYWPTCTWSFLRNWLWSQLPWDQGFGSSMWTTQAAKLQKCEVEPCSTTSVMWDPLSNSPWTFPFSTPS